MRILLYSLAVVFVLTLTGLGQQQIQIDASAPGKPFRHFWEQMFGSGRAALTLRESYRNDVRAVKQVTDFRYVRFHAILHDELGVYNEDEHGNPVYNFNYVDQIYDGLLKLGVKPVVEISFMPKKLAFNPDALHPFWYKQNVSPPKDMAKWNGLMKAFAEHLVARYGIDEVASWYFEVWNEPNIDFWGGVPQQESYFALYANTAKTLKAVSPRLRVGGPATAAAQWIPDFLRFCSENKVPVDFVSTHGYADEPVKRLMGTDEVIAPEDRVGAVIAHVRKQIDTSPIPKLPLLWTEWNVYPSHNARETAYVGPALANTIREADGNVDYLSFWTFSEVFEEGGPSRAPFTQFGIRAQGGINKPSFYDYALLHMLGNERIANASKNAIVTRSSDGSLAIAVWNLNDPDRPDHSSKVSLRFTNLPANAQVTMLRVDNDHSNVSPFYKQMGSPVSPTEEQAAELNRKTALEPAEHATLKNGVLDLDLAPNALVLIKIAKLPSK